MAKKGIPINQVAKKTQKGHLTPRDPKRRRLLGYNPKVCVKTKTRHWLNKKIYKNTHAHTQKEQKLRNLSKLSLSLLFLSFFITEANCLRVSETLTLKVDRKSPWLLLHSLCLILLLLRLLLLLLRLRPCSLAALSPTGASTLAPEFTPLTPP